MAVGATFHPKSGGAALLEALYDVKFSKHTPLIVVLLSMIYTIYRTQHYLYTTFKLEWFVSVPTAFFLELLVVAAAASLFIALRGAYIAELKDEDTSRACWGVRLAIVALVLAFVALLGVAWADAWKLTNDYAPAMIMTLIQATQMIFVFCFIIAADLEEREKLRVTYAEHARDLKQRQANTCPHCEKPVTSNNRARHIASCPSNPANQL